jgi:multiple sugar transport system substrate-binding protein
MSKLKFSISDHFSDGQELFEMIGKVGLKEHIQPKVQTISWQIMWSFLQRSLLEVDSFDVSEIGSTWVTSFADASALTEFDAEQLAALGDVNRFIPSAWHSAGPMYAERRFAIPFLADTRVVYYWRDALESIGVDETDAFGTPAKMEETISKLYAAGKPTWAAPTFAVTNVVHQIATWIWCSGGDFFTEDDTQTAFCSDEALAGIVSYFRLQRYMTHTYNSLDSVLEAFQKRFASVIISGPWFYRKLSKSEHLNEAMSNLGIALPPGPPFVGGSSLVIWKSDRPSRVSTSLKWIHHLTGLKAQKAVAQNTGLLPVIKEAFDSDPYVTDPHYAVFRDALRKGRPMPHVPYWGALEAELVHVFGSIWSALKEDPRYTPERAIKEYLIPMAQTFDGRLARHSSLPF